MRARMRASANESTTLARRAEAQREHLGQRAEVPCTDAKPVHPAGEVLGEAMGERRGEDRFSAPAGAHERETGGRRCEHGARERGQLCGAPLEPPRGGRKQAPVARVHAQHHSLHFERTAGFSTERQAPEMPSKERRLEWRASC